MKVVWCRRGVNDVARKLKLVADVVGVVPVCGGIPEGPSPLPEPDKECKFAGASETGFTMSNDITNVGSEV